MDGSSLVVFVLFLVTCGIPLAFMCSMCIIIAIDYWNNWRE